MNFCSLFRLDLPHFRRAVATLALIAAFSPISAVRADDEESLAFARVKEGLAQAETLTADDVAADASDLEQRDQRLRAAEREVVQKLRESNSGDSAAAMASMKTDGAPDAVKVVAVRDMTKELETLRAKLAASEKKNQRLTAELDEARNHLMVAETEVDRLSSIIDARRTSDIGGSRSQPSAAPRSAAAAQPVAPKGASDMPVATVIVEKANLRVGPSADNSPLMSISKGARLVVETRNGDWYRVVTPTGARAWISADVVSFPSDTHTDPNSTVRVKGYRGDLENDAISSIVRRTE